ncbi:MAG TPA: TIGR03435 family protein [Bryobacteraceae bacterium]
MRIERRNMPVLGWPSMARVGLSAAAMIGIAIGGLTVSRWIVPRWIAYAQAGPTFEVSPAAAGGRGSGPGRGAGISRTPLRIAFRATLVPDIMAFAYGLPLDRIERRPQWMYDDPYNVAVTTAAPAGLPEQKLMLQTLLETRFGLVVHRISYPSPVYFLVAGAKVNLTATEGDAEDLPEFRTGPTRVGRHISMTDLAACLYPRLQLPVLDKTGITGLFDIEIPGLLGHSGGAERTIQAVRDTLGLDLELHPGTAESLIIDHAEKPRVNP